MILPTITQRVWECIREKRCTHTKNCASFFPVHRISGFSIMSRPKVRISYWVLHLSISDYVSIPCMPATSHTRQSSYSELGVALQWLVHQTRGRPKIDVSNQITYSKWGVIDSPFTATVPSMPKNIYFFPEDRQTSTILGLSICLTVSSVMSSTSGLVFPSAEPATCSLLIFISADTWRMF